MHCQKNALFACFFSTILFLKKYKLARTKGLRQCHTHNIPYIVNDYWPMLPLFFGGGGGCGIYGTLFRRKVVFVVFVMFKHRSFQSRF